MHKKKKKPPSLICPTTTTSTENAPVKSLIITITTRWSHFNYEKAQ